MADRVRDLEATVAAAAERGRSLAIPRDARDVLAQLARSFEQPLEGEARVAANWKWLEELTEEERLKINMPVLESADRYDILVVGADRAKTAVMPSGPSPATVGIDQVRP